jgi:DNA-binding IclR family transcriptional regulator
MQHGSSARRKVVRGFRRFQAGVDQDSSPPTPGEVLDMSDKVNSSIDKTLSVLEAVSQNARGLSLADVVKTVGLPKTTTFRILETLAAREYVAWNEENERYYIGIKALEIGMSGLIGIDVVDVAVPYLKDLSAIVGDTSFLAVYSNGDVVYLYKAEGTASIQTTAHLGSRRPAYATALGKVILANQPIEETDRVLEKKRIKFTEKTVVDRIKLYEEFAAIRRDGYAIDDEGIEYGLYCLAVPIHNYTGSVIAAISVSGPIKRISENREKIVEELKGVGATISRRLGYVKSLKFRH